MSAASQTIRVGFGAITKALGSPTINQSPTTLKAFDGRGFHPYGILNDLPIELEGKTVAIEVEVVDAQLDYNLLLGRSWTYAMSAVVSSYFRMIMFPHKGKIVKVDQLSYYTSDPNSTGSIPFVGKSILLMKILVLVYLKTHL